LVADHDFWGRMTALRSYDTGLKVAHYAGDDEFLFAFV
jgi:hypothetical protein